ncbi:uncharacterized protein LOC111297630 [Durio zibethinus]|uniref:Uncharacterized protein LOC111297630 n=1 Tax=Durio zibethinus TaxID=66656 RepID=A0A6P5Z5M3_DURZI|nr:uncharacterized protein LOC111297630 [Durio zibethinus]
MAPTIVSLKLLVDSTSQRVLFAEAGKDFVGFLFNILSLPVGTVLGLLTKEDMVGCLGSLYESLENLRDTYMLPMENEDTLLKSTVSNHDANGPSLLPVIQSSTSTNLQPMENKDTLLKSTVSNHDANVPPLLPIIQSSTSTNLYMCVNSCNRGSCGIYVANDSKSICPSCNNIMSQIATVVNPPTKKASSSHEGAYVKGVITYMIKDDLAVRLMSTISCLTLLNKFNIKDVGILKEKASLQSKTVLIDVFLGKKAGQSDVSTSNSSAVLSIAI